MFQVLSSRVLALVSQTFAAVRESLSDEKETLADTRKVLAEGFAATKREVDESLRAFNQERDFYAAAVGIPGLRTAQYLIDHMMPGLIAAKLEKSLAQSISNASHPNVKKMILKSVAAGKAAPLLTGARFYDVGETAMAFDVDVKWISDINADMDVVPAMGLPAENCARARVRARRQVRRHRPRAHGGTHQARPGVRRRRRLVPGPALHRARRQGRRASR